MFSPNRNEIEHEQTTSYLHRLVAANGERCLSQESGLTASTTSHIIRLPAYRESIVVKVQPKILLGGGARWADFVFSASLACC